MRDLKFRAWIKKTSSMEYLDFLNLSKAQFCGNWELSKPEHLFDVATVKGNLFNFDELEIMQFTGCLDLNGVEIYEGDILELTYLSGTVKKKFSVSFDKACFGVAYSSFFTSLTPIAWDSYEVIGNIYEDKHIVLDID